MMCICDFAMAGELQYGTIPGLEKQLEDAEAAAGNAMLREEVTSEDIAGVVSRWIGELSRSVPLSICGPMMGMP